MTIPAFTTNDRRPPASTNVIDCSFTKTGSGLIADEAVQIGATGSGMTVGQAYSNLNIDTGTTAGAEVLLRSRDSFSGAHMARYRISLSQRIVNQHVVAMLADLVAADAAFSVDATGLLITVTLPADHGFTPDNIGQTCMLGGAQGAALSHPGRYSITGVSGNQVTFSPVFACSWTRSTTTATISFQGGAPIFSIAESATVSASSDTAAIVNGSVSLLTQGNSNFLATSTFTCLNAGATSGTLTLTMSAKAWTPSATGTLTVYGWNYIAYIRNGTSATAAWKDTQRRGWSSGAASVTKTSDLAPLSVVDQFWGDCQLEAFSDASPATVTTSLMFNQRGTTIDSLPPVDTPLYFFLSVHNGVSAPASTTRVSLGHFRTLDIGINKVQISSFDQSGYASLADIRVSSMPTTSGVAGAAAHDAGVSGNPVRVAGRARTSNYTTVANDDTADLLTTLVGALIQKPYAIPEQGWSASLSLTTTTAAPIQTAAGSGLKRHITAGQVINTGASTVDLIILDGATERWRLPLPINVPVTITFPTEIVTTANTALNANLSAVGTVRFNAQGYTAP